MLLALDAGITTGFCALGPERELVAYGAIPFDLLAASLKGLHEAWHFERVICERAFPYKNSRLGNQLRAVLDRIGTEFGYDSIEWIIASQWKSTRYVSLPTPRGLSQHEKDAFRIAHFAFDRASLST